MGGGRGWGMGDGGGNSKVVPFWKGVYSKMKDERICSQGGEGVQTLSF